MESDGQSVDQSVSQMAERLTGWLVHWWNWTS